MGETAAVVSDIGDTREFDCVLPDDVPVSSVASRLAEMIGFPLSGPQNEHVTYGFVAEGSPLLPGACPERSRREGPGVRSEAAPPNSIRLRLVPELTIGAGGHRPDHPESVQRELPLITIRDQRRLVEDANLDLPADVSIAAAAHREIDRFASRDRYAECAGLLLGTVGVERKVRAIHIEAVACAQGAVETRTGVRVTLEAWESMLAARDREYPDLMVLGWFHTHAGWGVFLSESDVFVHTSFFAGPNMVAYVLDPTSGRESFFRWRDGEIVQCPTYGLVGAPKQAPPRTRKRGRGVLAACAAGVVAAAGLYAGLSTLRGEPPKPAPVHISQTAAKPASPKPSGETERIYVLGKRDNLWTICNRVYGDGELAPALARYNGLRTFTRLQVGQKIKLPPEEVLRQ